MNIPLLNIEDLSVHYRHGKSYVPAVRNAHLSLLKGETVAVVGESGCGKSTLALSVMGLLPPVESFISSGKIWFEGRDLLRQSPEQWRRTRGSAISMVFQDPFSSLNPVLPIETQMRETLEVNQPHPRWKEEALGLLKKVQLLDSDRILRSYPHQISGGQRQRVMIAMALARKPQLLIADEPTTALDVTVQAEIIKILKDLQKNLHMSMLFITHNMALAADFSERMAVMYAGQIVEVGKTSDVLKKPKHPYTRALLKCLPTLKKRRGPLPVLEGHPPHPADLSTGCAFYARCPEKFEPCPVSEPTERAAGKQTVRCYLYK